MFPWIPKCKLRVIQFKYLPIKQKPQVALYSENLELNKQ